MDTTPVKDALPTTNQQRRWLWALLGFIVGATSVLAAIPVYSWATSYGKVCTLIGGESEIVVEIPPKHAKEWEEAELDIILNGTRYTVHQDREGIHINDAGQYFRLPLGEHPLATEVELELRYTTKDGQQQTSHYAGALLESRPNGDDCPPYLRGLWLVLDDNGDLVLSNEYNFEDFFPLPDEETQSANSQSATRTQPQAEPQCTAIGAESGASFSASTKLVKQDRPVTLTIDDGTKKHRLDNLVPLEGLEEYIEFLPLDLKEGQTLTYTLEYTDPSGKARVETLQVKAHEFSPNGPECPPTVYQTSVNLTQDGTLLEQQENNPIH